MGKKVTKEGLTEQDKKDFMMKYYPAAKEAVERTGVRLDPLILVGQAYLESRGGKSLLSAKYNNMSGVKHTPKSKYPSVSMATTEYDKQGRPYKKIDKFVVYPSATDAFVSLLNGTLSNPRYKNAKNSGDNVFNYAASLQQGGYATDPTYAKQVTEAYNSVKRLFNKYAKEITGAPNTQVSQNNANTATQSNLNNRGRGMPTQATNNAVNGAMPDEGLQKFAQFLQDAFKQSSQQAQQTPVEAPQLNLNQPAIQTPTPSPVEALGGFKLDSSLLGQALNPFAQQAPQINDFTLNTPPQNNNGATPQANNVLGQLAGQQPLQEGILPIAPSFVNNEMYKTLATFLGGGNG